MAPVLAAEDGVGWEGGSREGRDEAGLAGGKREDGVGRGKKGW